MEFPRDSEVRRVDTMEGVLPQLSRLMVVVDFLGIILISSLFSSSSPARSLLSRESLWSETKPLHPRWHKGMWAFLRTIIHLGSESMTVELECRMAWPQAHLELCISNPHGMDNVCWVICNDTGLFPPGFTIPFFDQDTGYGWVESHCAQVDWLGSYQGLLGGVWLGIDLEKADWGWPAIWSWSWFWMSTQFSWSSNCFIPFGSHFSGRIAGWWHCAWLRWYDWPGRTDTSFIRCNITDLSSRGTNSVRTHYVQHVVLLGSLVFQQVAAPCPKCDYNEGDWVWTRTQCDVNWTCPLKQTHEPCEKTRSLRVTKCHACHFQWPIYGACENAVGLESLFSCSSRVNPVFFSSTCLPSNQSSRCVEEKQMIFCSVRVDVYTANFHGCVEFFFFFFSDDPFSNPSETLGEKNQITSPHNLSDFFMAPKKKKEGRFPFSLACIAFTVLVPALGSGPTSPYTKHPAQLSIRLFSHTDRHTLSRCTGYIPYTHTHTKTHKTPQFSTCWYVVDYIYIYIFYHHHLIIIIDRRTKKIKKETETRFEIREGGKRWLEREDRRFRFSLLRAMSKNRP
ncbi:hypothetical protein VP01_1328g2 [Puccinia sorghi]|uniref:Uncharacterized protein n=1 Tax=Puccinia sorghi TaxID=27349 RepID=A0A0L6VN31_9BASI|nr:hypothetical protein VP01_1328g2 [Puccinia sorghi]